MAIGLAEQSMESARARERYTAPLILMLSLYFGIGFITALNDILVAHFKDLFHLSNFAAQLVQSCFFGAYFFLSVPCGWLVGRIGYRAGIVGALGVMAAGLLLFQPASRIIVYPLFLFALFVVGSGLALLQVAINPYVGALGPPETASSRLNLAGVFNSLATTIAPKVGAIFIFVAAGATSVQLARSVRTPYLILAGCALLLALVAGLAPLPELIPRHESTAGAARVSAWSFRQLRLGAVAIFFYVGAEVAIGSVMINYLAQPAMGALSHEAAARYVSYYWGCAMLARLVGFFALRQVSSERALAAVSAAGMLLVATTIFGHGRLALWALVACGLCNAVMWPCIFPLGLRGLGRATSQGSGILVSMVVGGAVIPLVQGGLADRFGMAPSFAIVLVCYGYLLFFALSGHKPANAAQV